MIIAAEPEMRLCSGNAQEGTDIVARNGRRRMRRRQHAQKAHGTTSPGLINDPRPTAPEN